MYMYASVSVDRFMIPSGTIQFHPLCIIWCRHHIALRYYIIQQDIAAPFIPLYILRGTIRTWVHTWVDEMGKTNHWAQLQEIFSKIVLCGVLLV